MTDAELEKAFWALMASDPNFDSESVNTKSWCLRAFILGYNKRKKEVGDGTFIPSAPGGIDPYSGRKRI